MADKLDEWRKSHSAPGSAAGVVSGQVRLDFDHIDKNGLKKVVQAFNKAGCEVADVEATNKPKREMGMPVKRFTVIMTDRTAVEIAVKSDGTAFQAKTGVVPESGTRRMKPFPVKNTDNLGKAIKELAAQLKYENVERAKREKRAAKTAALKETKPKVSTSRKKKLEALEAEISELEPQVTSLEDQQSKLKEAEDKAAEGLDKAQSELLKEQDRNKSLKKEKDSLEQELEDLKAGRV